MSRLLFTCFPSNDLGVIARLVPIARELRLKSHQISFSHPSPAPQKIIAEAGFENPLPDEPLYHVFADFSGSGMLRLLRRGSPLRTLKSLVFQMKYSSRFGTADVWNMDHFMALSGLADRNFDRALVAALVGIMNTFKPDAVVDSWNPWACIAARYLRKPLITVIQADSHPQSRGFIWWKDPPSYLPTPVPAVNDGLSE
jgi:hypothetical protein